jgi:hypothetical protein
MTPRARTCPGVSLFFDELDTAIFGAALISSIIGDGIFLPESDRGHSSGSNATGQEGFHHAPGAVLRQQFIRRRRADVIGMPLDTESVLIIPGAKPVSGLFARRAGQARNKPGDRR